MTTPFKELEQEQRRHADARKRLLDGIQKAIKDLPDNPRISRLPGSPRAFTMSFKDVGNNLSVEHHDFKLQYELIAEEIGKSDDPSTRLVKILSDGRIIPSHGTRITLHPDVVANICKMAGIRWKSVARWPEGTCPGDISDDFHDTREQATAITRRLQNEGFGGDRKVFPTSTWTEAVCPT